MADVKLTFGRFEGLYISQVPSYYLLYLINNAYDATIIKTADDEWKHRSRMGTHWLMPHKKRFS